MMFLENYIMKEFQNICTVPMFLDLHKIYVWAQSTHIALTAVKALRTALKHYTALNFNSVKA